MLRGRHRQPYARPNAGAILQSRPIAAANLCGPRPAKALPPLPVYRLGEDPLLLTQAAPLGAHRRPIDRDGVGSGGQASPLLLSLLVVRHC